MARRPWTAPITWPAVGLAGVVVIAVGAAETTLAWAAGTAPPARYVSDVLFGVLWAAAGLVAWRTRPVSRMGPLMVVLGALFLVNAPWGFGLRSDFPLRSLITVLGLAGFWLQLAVAGHLLLAYPGGQLGRRADRFVVRLGYASAAVATVVLLLVMSPDPAICGERCQVSPIRLVDSRGVYALARSLVYLWFGALALSLLALLLHRLATASRLHRRDHAFALLTSLAAVALAVASFAVAAAARTGAIPTRVLYPAAYLGLVAVPGALLLGLFRQRLAYAAVADLVRGLGEVAPTRLQSALARTLRDPDLVVVFPVGGAGDFVDVDGRWVPVPPDGSRAVTLLGEPSAPVAALLHDPALTDHRDLLDAVAATARLALENARLQAEVRAQLAEVRASRSRIVAAADTERRRLERNLHDGAQQRLLGIGLTLQVLRLRLADSAEPLLDEAEQELRVAIRELRDLAQGIHPAVLTDEGLLAAVGVAARRCPVPVTVEGDVPGRLHRHVEATAYYVVSESLQNVVKHAQASQVLIQVSISDGRLVVVVSDDGVGGASPDGGSGLRGLVDRAVAADGSLDLVSPPGRGTTVVARLPCE